MTYKTKSKMSKIGSKKFVLLLLVIGVLPFYTSTVRAWGLTGHRVVAEVAYHHLTKKAHKNVDQVLGKHGMVYWARTKVSLIANQEQWNGNAYQYIYEWRDEVRWQLYAAGIRLAQVLNAIYK